jgi:hypothetical protein
VGVLLGVVSMGRGADVVGCTERLGADVGQRSSRACTRRVHRDANTRLTTLARG